MTAQRPPDGPASAPPAGPAPHRRGRAGRLAIAGLGLALVAANLVPSATGSGERRLMAPLHRSRHELLGLAVPGLFTEMPRGERPDGASPPPRDGDGVVRAALLPGSAGSRERFPYIGLAPLALALAAFVGARGAAARALQLALALALLAATAATDRIVAAAAAPLLCAALAGLACVGLAHAGAPRDARRPATTGLLAAALAVVAAAILAGVALRAGAASDSALLESLLARVGRSRTFTAEVLVTNATWLRAVLDRGALAAFASMTALLLHLRSRRGWSLALLLAVSLADVATASRA